MVQHGDTKNRPAHLFTPGILVVLTMNSSMAIVPPLEWIQVRSHSDKKHGRDEIIPKEIRARIQGETYERLLPFYSVMRSTFLLLCKIPGTPKKWGGWIFGANSHVELTAFVAPWSYWQRVLERDVYFPAWMADIPCWSREEER